MGEQKPWRQTPLIESSNLSKAAGCRIFLKLENLQPCGSFKSRALGHHTTRALERSSHPDRVHFYTSSGGNAGLACVHAANFHGRPSTVVVPLSTKPMMLAKLRAAGASEVLQVGATWREADTHLREVVMPKAEAGDMKEEAVYCPPFDHPDVWEGNATMVGEMRAQFEGLWGEKSMPEVVVCSVGGGGLFSGVMQGMEEDEKAWKDTVVLAMETEGAESLAKSLQAGELVTLPGITSQATSLGATRVAERTFELGRKGQAEGRVKSVVLTDAEAAMGAWRFADDERMMVEMACGVNVALCYGGRLEKALGRPVRKDEKVVIVVCGGQNITVAMLEAWRKEFGDLDSEQPNRLQQDQLADVPSAATVPNGRS